MRNYSQLLFCTPVLGDDERSACSLASITPSKPEHPHVKEPPHCSPLARA